MYRRGIKQIKHLVKNDGNFKHMDEINHEYNLNITFLEYLQLRTSIPFKWQHSLREANLYNREPVNDNNNDNYNTVLKFDIGILPKTIGKISTSELYIFMVNTIHVDIPVTHTKWQSNFENTIDFQKVYTLAKQNAQSTKLYAFQFSILHQYVPHNYKLYNMKLITSPNCNHCNSIDSILHRFIECKDIKSFWRQIINYFNTIHNTNFILHPENIIFGMVLNTHDPIIYILNAFILLGKYWIHICRIKENTPHIQGFLYMLRKYMENEKYIHTLHNTYHKYTSRWEQLHNNLN